MSKQLNDLTKFILIAIVWGAAIIAFIHVVNLFAMERNVTAYVAQAVVACIAIFYLAANYKKYSLISKTETSTISSLQEGFYAIKGKVVSLGEQLISPYSNKPCAYYEFNVEQIKGRYRSAAWASIIEDKKGQKFGVDDGSGIAIIDLQHADVQIKTDEKISSGFPSQEVDENLLRAIGKYKSEYIENKDDVCNRGLLSGELVRYSEKYIQVGDDIYILGEVNGREQSKPLFKKNMLPLLVSDKAEHELLTKYIVKMIISIASLAAVAWGVIHSGISVN